MAEELTPMMRQYINLKREVPPGTILMFRLGDFYEMFGQDAVTASPILGATLTSRGGQPMCGVPYHALNTYLAKLIRAGMTAAICEQIEDPKTAKGIVRRDITRIITPGTVTEEGLLDEAENHYIAAISSTSFAILDLATGEFFVEDFPTRERLEDALAIIRPSERFEPNESNSWTFQLDAATECLNRHFKTLSVDGFGLKDHPHAVCAAGALLYYVGTTLRHPLEHVRHIRLRQSDEQLGLDATTLRHLQILPANDLPKEATLTGVLDVTKTPMGARKLRTWLSRPLARAEEINARLDAVGALIDDRPQLSRLRQALTGVRDLERLVQKVDSRRANPRDLRALAQSLVPVKDIRAELLSNSDCLLQASGARMNPCEELTSLVTRALVEDPPVLLTNPGYIATGYNAELDEIRSISSDRRKWLADYQAAEQKRTGISKLKIRNVSTFGIVIEIPKGSLDKVPEDYQRRQTLVTGERYTTPELKNFEREVFGAEERALAIEKRLFEELVERVAQRTEIIQETAQALGVCDVLAAFADRALALGYTRPFVDESDEIRIEDGRHPIIEQLPDAEPFVPNSTVLNTKSEQIHVITGPNMAGKSTYLRQVATLVIMAQAGCWVPASGMRVGVIDRVFTRIGAGDDLSRGRSTFLVEMQETAEILNNVTMRSLVVLDEIGRGTSTYDGISIAWAVAEYLYQNRQARPKTLFATHYHELTDLADKFDGIKNYTVKVVEQGDRIVFLRRIVPGVAQKSFGIHVAAMAGLPPEVVKRANEILTNLESADLDIDVEARPVRRPRKKLSELPGQMEFF